MFIWRTICFPLTLLYSILVKIRNWLYDRGLSRSTYFDANVIGVGNLAIGGTGKSPMVEYLIRHYAAKEFRVNTLSRGYGRKTHGFRIASPEDTALTLGDEPYMYHSKFDDQICVAVAEDRELAIPQLLGSGGPEVVLMDDGFQHRRVQPSVSMVLTTFDNPFYEDFLLPAGRLREHREGVRRADFVMVTKCPARMSESDQVRIKERISSYTAASVFFSTVEYLEPVSFVANDLALNHRVVAISGMADAVPFEQFVKTQYDLVLSHSYRDHYRYQEQDVRDIIEELGEDISLLVTEKDMVKLKTFKGLHRYSCYYLPIRIKFLKDEALFLSLLDSKLKNDVQ